MSFLKRMQKHYKVQSDLSDMPMGDRYPNSKKKLSDKDIKELDDLFSKLNRMARDEPEFDKVKDRIEELLGVQVA